MKSFNIIFAFLLLACAGLSFIEAEELTTSTQTKPEIQPDADTISRKAFQMFIDMELVRPISTCLEENDPLVFMTKCYTRLLFELDARYEKEKLYAHSNIKGTLILVDCGSETRMADITANYGERKITVRESFRLPRKSLEDYLTDICAFIKENGIPSDH